MQMITERTDRVVPEDERKNLVERLLRVPENPDHGLVLMRAARLLDGEIEYNELRIRYNQIPPCQREAWIGQVAEALNEYEQAGGGDGQ